MSLFNKNHFALWIWTAAVLLPGVSSRGLEAQQRSVPPEVLAYADMVLYNGQILTVDDDFTIVEAVAIRDGEFLARGSNQRIRAMAGPNTRQINLAGKTVIPGFIDSHTHFHNRAERGLWPNLVFQTRDQWLRQVKNLVDAKEPGEWVIFRTSRTVDQPWAQSSFGMTRHDLDPISPNNPVFVWTSPPGNDALANSYALREANMPSDTFGLVKDPQTGEPTGALEQAAYGTMFYEVIPQISVEERLPLYRTVMRRWNAEGKITIMSRFSGSVISVFKELWSRGELTLRIRVAHEFARNAQNPEAIIKRLGDLNGFGDAWLRIAAANVGNPDGGFFAGRGWTRSPKLPGTGHSPDPSQPDFGFVPYFQDKDRSDWRTIPILNRYGWGVLGIHTNGDASVDALLSAFEVANQERPLAGRRFAWDHSVQIRPEHIATAQRLGIMASVGAPAGGSESTIKLYGADEVFKMSPIKSILEAGIRVVMEGGESGDAPPFRVIERLVTRTDDKGRVWNKDEAVTREQALYMSTNWASYYTGDEKILGTIETGKLADFVIIDRDYLTIPADEIAELNVLMTVAEGKVLYEDEDGGF